MRRVLILFCLILISSQAVTAAEKSAHQLLPQDALIYLEIANPADLVDLAVNHPLRAKVESTPQVVEAKKTKEYQQMLAGIDVVEGHLETDLVTAISKLTGGGIYAAFQPASEGVVILIHSTDADLLEKTRGTIVGLAKLADPEAIKSSKYRDVKVYTRDELKIAVMDDWLILTNKSELGKSVVDAYRDGSSDSLSQNERFQAAYSSHPKSSAWGYVDLKSLRDAGEAAELFSGKAENPGAEILIGGLLDNLQHAGYASLSISVKEQQLAIQLELPHKAEWISEPRQHFFGVQGKGTAPSVGKADNIILSLGSYRDFSHMWLHAGDLFDEATNDELAEAESNLSTLFSGKDFGEEILGAIHPEVQLLVTQQSFEDAEIVPTIKLPSFALAGKLRDAEKMKPELRRTFQSLIGFLNVIGVQEGNPQFDIESVKSGKIQFVAAEYLAQDVDADDNNVPIHYNFSPTVAFAGDTFVLSSTKALAMEIAKGSQKKKTSKKKQVVTNTVARLDIAELAKALKQNERHLIAQNMLEEGHTREEAETEIAILFEILKMLDDIRMQFDVADDAVQLKMATKLKSVE